MIEEIEKYLEQRKIEMMARMHRAHDEKKEMMEQFYSAAVFEINQLQKKITEVKEAAPF